MFHLRDAFLIGSLSLLLCFTLACSNETAQAISNAKQDQVMAGSWINFADLAQPVQEVGVAELDGIIYVVGGIPAQRGATNLVQAYDYMSDSWRVLAPLPRSLHHVAVVALNGGLYSLGGFTGSFGAVNNAYSYDPQSNVWTEIAPIPVLTGSPSAVVIDDLIYLIGGQGSDPQQDSLFSYDAKSNSWSPLRSMPTGRNHFAAAAIDGKLYAVGGRISSSFTLNTLEVYDPAIDEWTRLSNMPTGRSGIAAAAYRGCLFVFGGEGNDRRVNSLGVFEENEMYNPITDSWQTMTPMALARHGIGAAVLEDRIHIPGGGPVEGFGVTDAHDAYAPPSDVNCE